MHVKLESDLVRDALQQLSEGPCAASASVLLSALVSGRVEIGAPDAPIPSLQLRTTFAVRAKQAERAGVDGAEHSYLAAMFSDPFDVYIVSIQSEFASGGLFLAADGSPIGCVGARREVSGGSAEDPRDTNEA